MASASPPGKPFSAERSLPYSHTPARADQLDFDRVAQWYSKRATPRRRRWMGASFIPSSGCPDRLLRGDLRVRPNGGVDRHAVLHASSQWSADGRTVDQVSADSGRTVAVV